MPGYWRAPCVRLSRLGDSVSCVLSGVALRRFLALAVSIGSLPENLVLAPACTSPLLPAAATSLPPSAIKPNPISSVKILNNKKVTKGGYANTSCSHKHCTQLLQPTPPLILFYLSIKRSVTTLPYVSKISMTSCYLFPGGAGWNYQMAIIVFCRAFVLYLLEICSNIKHCQRHTKPMG